MDPQVMINTGFSTGRCTVDAIRRIRQLAAAARAGGYRKCEACLAAALDLRNAFITAR